MTTIRCCCVAAAVALSALVGCGRGQEGGDAPSLDDVKKEAGEALGTAKAYLAQKSDEAVAAMQGQLDDVAKKIDKLEAQLDDAGEQVRERFEEAKADLDAKLAAAEAKLDKTRHASGEAWQDLAAGFAAAYDELQKAFTQAAARFAEETADAE